MNWKIYYGDGSTFSSDDGLPNDAPSYNVQVIVQPDKTNGGGNVGRQTMHLHDWYYWRTDVQDWYGGDLHGLLDLLLSRAPITAICQGRVIPTNQFQIILKRAKTDLGFPNKSASTRIETP